MIALVDYREGGVPSPLASDIIIDRSYEVSEND